MRRVIWTTFCVILLFGGRFKVQADEEDPLTAGISSPLAGEAIQGNFAISGTTGVAGMEAWDLSFAYVHDNTGTWFLIAEGTEAIVDDVITQWPTNTITDGYYNLKLVIDLDNGDLEEIIVPDIRVRNYSPIETSTPTLTPTKDPARDTATPSLTPTPYPPTPTPLPTNPVEITPVDVTNNLTYGAIITVVLFLLIGLYISIRRTLQK